MSYDVDVHQCITVLENVATDAEDYEAANKAMSTAVEGAARDSRSELVAGALSGYAEKAYGHTIQSVVTLTANAQQGLSEALIHFQQGDEEMARTSVTSLGEADGAGHDAPGSGRGGAGSLRD